MPSRRSETAGWRQRVADIVASIDEIERFLQGHDLQSFRADPRTLKAVAFDLQIIGEASNHLPDFVKSKCPQIPWDDIRGMRNLLVHQYFDMDEEIVWYTATDHLPELKRALLVALDEF